MNRHFWREFLFGAGLAALILLCVTGLIVAIEANAAPPAFRCVELKVAPGVPHEVELTDCEEIPVAKLGFEV